MGKSKSLTMLQPGGSGHTPGLAFLDMDGTRRPLVMRQTADWSGKRLVVTPQEEKFAFAAANGRPPVAHTECAPLATAISSILSSATWTDGQKAVFAYYTTQLDPLMLYRLGHPFSIPGDERSGMGLSVVAHRYDLRALPLASFQDGWKASVRIHCPSHIFHDPSGTSLPSAAWNGMGGSNELYVRVCGELPEHPSAVWAAPGDGEAETRNIVSLTPDGTNLNNGWIYGRAVPAWFNYDPFDTDSVETPSLPLRAFATDGDDPADYYYDVNLGVNSRNMISSHTDGGFWLLIAFKCCNGFSVDNTSGMNPSFEQGHLLYIHRAELVLSNLTKARYNT